MIKKFSFFILVLFSLLFNNFVFAVQDIIPIENVFNDISKDYKYYDEMQYLYNKGIIEPEEDHKWHPQKLLERDDFVGISMETSCRRCIIPHEEEYLHKYNNEKPFFDVGLDNKDYYCIAEAADLKFVVGYRKNDKCDDGTWQKNKVPFCTKNNIKLEEAIAVIMRMSSMVTHEYAEQIVNDIQKYPTNFPDLAKDVKAKNNDGESYSFYAYFKKALDFKLIEYDKTGRKNIYTFFDVEKYNNNGEKHFYNYMRVSKGEYLKPSSYITKEQFMVMAYIALKANACPEKIDDYFALKMLIYDKECSYEDQRLGKCNISDKKDELNTFDFKGLAEGTCDEGIDELKGYLWKFVNLNTGEIIEKEGIYINNYKFLKSGEYKVYLTATDNCGQTAEVWNTINIIGEINDENYKNIDLIVSIEADPIIGYGPLEVDFEGIAIGGVPPYEYYWDFGDGGKGRGKFIKHIFIEEGLYRVILTVIDSGGNTATASVLIKVLENNCDNDRDGDGVNDCLDKCPLVFGEKKNAGCPILISKPNIINISDCIYELKRTGYTFGNVVCDTCPCNYFIDFKSNIRACDTLIPAITGSGETTIFARGKGYVIGDIFK